MCSVKKIKAGVLKDISAKEQYIKGHDRACAQLQFTICKELGIKLDSDL